MSYLLNISKEKLKELKIQAAKEGTTIKHIIEDQIDEYLKIHKDGNPQFTIEQFADPDFLACPAFYRDGRTWENYIQKATDEEKQKLKQQILLLDHKLCKHL
jgi:hypothetical protein